MSLYLRLVADNDERVGLFMAKLLISTGRLRTIDMSENSLGDIGVASVAGNSFTYASLYR
jgi:hypothetical protein